MLTLYIYYALLIHLFLLMRQGIRGNETTVLNGNAPIYFLDGWDKGIILLGLL